MQMLAGQGDVPKIKPVLGEYRKVTVQKGETLFKIARKNNVGVPNLMRLNGLKRERVKPGQKLLLPTLFIVPRAPETGIVLNVPECRVYLFEKGQLKGRHAVTVGSRRTPTPTGQYRLVSRLVNPKWDPPADLAERKGIADEPVGPGPENPLGDRWMGWNKPGYGFHSTNAPRSIGRVVSNGCVRLYPEQARSMFQVVQEGMPIYSEYEPVKIGTLGGRFYLSVAPDPYGRGLSKMSRVQELLRRAGMLELVRPEMLGRIVRGKQAYPHRLLGEYEKVIVNGRPLEMDTAPILSPDGWYVPARAVVEALGGRIAPAENNTVRIELNGQTLAFAPGQQATQSAGQTMHSPLEGVRVQNTLFLSVRALKQMKVRADWQRGKTLALSS